MPPRVLNLNPIKDETIKNEKFNLKNEILFKEKIKKTKNLMETQECFILK